MGCSCTEVILINLAAGAHIPGICLSRSRVSESLEAHELLSANKKLVFLSLVVVPLGVSAIDQKAFGYSSAGMCF
jgi:hypothetical protein